MLRVRVLHECQGEVNSLDQRCRGLACCMIITDTISVGGVVVLTRSTCHLLSSTLGLLDHVTPQSPDPRSTLLLTHSPCSSVSNFRLLAHASGQIVTLTNRTNSVASFSLLSRTQEQLDPYVQGSMSHQDLGVWGTLPLVQRGVLWRDPTARVITAKWSCVCHWATWTSEVWGC